MRESIRREILDEMREIQQSVDDLDGRSKTGFFARELSEEERAAVSASEEFLEFIERSSKIVERALDIEYDVLADYGIDSNGDSEDATGRRLKQLIQFYDERWSKKRMISDIHFSPKVPVPYISNYRAMLTFPLVSRTSPGRIYQKSVCPTRSGWPRPSMEYPSPRPCGIHLPRAK